MREIIFLYGKHQCNPLVSLSLKTILISSTPCLRPCVSSFHTRTSTRPTPSLTSLERIRSMDYAAVLCDAHQPRLEGIGFVRAVQKIHPECPVLLLIEKHQEDLVRQAMDAGAYDVLVKPVEEGTLLFAVRRAIEVSRLRCQVKREEAQFVASVRTGDERSRSLVRRLWAAVAL